MLSLFSLNPLHLLLQKQDHAPQLRDFHLQLLYGLRIPVGPTFFLRLFAADRFLLPGLFLLRGFSVYLEVVLAQLPACFGLLCVLEFLPQVRGVEQKLCPVRFVP